MKNYCLLGFKRIKKCNENYFFLFLLFFMFPYFPYFFRSEYNLFFSTSYTRPSCLTFIVILSTLLINKELKFI